MVEAFKKQCGITSLRDPFHVPPKDTNGIPEKSFVPSVDVTTLEDIKEVPKDQALEDTTIHKIALEDTMIPQKETKQLHIRSPLDISNFIIA